MTEKPAPEAEPHAGSREISTRWKALRGALIPLALLGVAFSFLRSCPRGSVTGEIRATGLPHGDFVLQPVTCFSGGHWGFDGIWVVTETLTSGSRRGFKGGLKIQKNEAGDWEAYVESPLLCEGFKCRQLRVERDHCQRFDLEVSSRSVWLRYRGHAMLDCVFPEGGTLKTELTFRGCAAVPSHGSAD